jgi:hypothetical protein
MNLDSSPELYLIREKAIKTIAESLKYGYLTLFIGAGISKSATKEFPKWNELVNTCCHTKSINFDKKKAGLVKKNDDININYLLSLMDEVKRNCSGDKEFNDLVSNSLYENVQYDYSLMSKDLLFAIGSIIMGSIRGNSDCVINYNFDDLFEWYLSQHGFKIQIISKFPTIITKSDVNIYHPHGFLPYLSKYNSHKTNIVFTLSDYECIMSEQVNPWNEFQRNVLSSKLGLFIGLSGDDQHLNSLCSFVYNTQSYVNKKRILGFIILNDSPKNKSTENDNLGRGLINLYIKDFCDLPPLLLEICQRASEL